MNKTEQFRQLPREYYYQIEHDKKKNLSPKSSIGLISAGLLFDLFAFIFAFSIGEPTFALFLSIAFLAKEIVVIVILTVLVIGKMWERKAKLWCFIELIGFILFAYSAIPFVVSMFAVEDVNILFIILVLLLFPLGFAFQVFVVHRFKLAILAGKFQPGGEGLFTKATLQKYLPYISIITAILEGSRLTVIIWARLTTRIWGNIVAIIILPFVAIVLVLGISVAVATTYIDYFCLRLFPDWENIKWKNAK